MKKQFLPSITDIGLPSLVSRIVVSKGTNNIRDGEISFEILTLIIVLYYS